MRARTLSAYREEEGLLFPATDVKINRLIRKAFDHIDLAIGLCKKHDVVVQAGGNVGLWPRRMSRTFKAVYTFEPDPVNFGALAINTADRDNVVRFQAALGCEPAFVDMERVPTNCGAHCIDGAGIIPTLKVDDLHLPECDLIYLDVEGFELPALKGAVMTINRFRPVIGLEDKGLSDRYGVAQGEVIEWLTRNFDYRIAETIRKDTILVPA